MSESLILIGICVGILMGWRSIDNRRAKENAGYYERYDKLSAEIDEEIARLRQQTPVDHKAIIEQERLRSELLATVFRMTS